MAEIVLSCQSCFLPLPKWLRLPHSHRDGHRHACAKATSGDDLFLRLEAFGVTMRVHPDRTPQMYHFAKDHSAAAMQNLPKLVQHSA